MPVSVAQADIDAAVAAVKKFKGNKLHAAKYLGIADSTLRNRLRMAERPSRVSPAEVSSPAVLRVQDENKRLRAQILEIQRDNLSAEEVRKSIFKLAEHTAAPPRWLLKSSTASSVTGVPSTIWSDWHLGERVSPAEVNGVNEFNREIAEKRVQRLAERIIDLCVNHMTNPRYPGIVVNLIGDIVSGEIHPELAETNEDEILPIILWAVDIITAAIRLLRTKFHYVFVACAPGNHGRMFDKKPRAKRYVYRNADWLIYCLLERVFRTDPNVSFSIPSTGECLYQVYDHRYLAVHGDDLGVKGGDGIIGAIGPIMRGEIKVHTSSAHVGRDYDTLLMGHWHQTLWLPRAIVNNTLKGYDEYARRMLRAPATPPSQSLWFTHPKHGITARWEVLVGDGRKASAAPWCSWEVPA